MKGLCRSCPHLDSKVSCRSSTQYLKLLLCRCRWTLSSKRLPAWTTWPSCMRAGQPGCEHCAASCLWSSEGLEIHQSPEGLGCRRTAPGHPRRRKREADATSALPNSWATKLGQQPRGIAATTGDQGSLLSGPADPPSFQGLVGKKPMPEVGRGGKEGKGLLAVQLGQPSPLTCIAHVPKRITAPV